MTENAALFDEVFDDQKTSVKHKWRGKLFSSEVKPKKYTEAEKSEAVLDFLRPSNSRGSQDLPAPRIDTSAARRWPTASEVINANTINPDDRPRKAPRRTDLHVTFNSSAPKVIGEGGDEAELPTIVLSRSREPFTPEQLSQTGILVEDAAGSQQLNLDEQASSLDNQSILNENEVRSRPPLQRAATGLDIRPRGGSVPISDQDYTPNRLAHARSESLRDRLRFRNTDQHTEPSPGNAKGTASHLEVNFPRPVEKTATSQIAPLLKLPSFDQSLSFENSISPLPSPQPPSILSNQSIETHPIATPAPTPSPTTSPSPQPPQTPLSKTLSHSNRHVRPLSDDDSGFSHDKEINGVASKNIETSKPAPEIRSFSIRDVARNLGDNALEDFSSRVRRFNDLFQIGASITAPVMEISFAQWIRTSAYWFLKGRGELENAVRTEARDPQGALPEKDSNISHGLRQAYLDLAKAWWVLREITCNHPELRKVGNANPSSLIAIVKSIGDLKLAELIEVHLAITANMRALTMSMKKNNRLPPTSFEIQGLETRMFVEFPGFPSRVAGLLSERSQFFNAGDSRSTEAFFPVPVGDTKRHFVYSSVIVDLLDVTQGDKCEEIRLPCVLSVLRERADRDLKAVIASQDGKVNLLIQPDKKAGLTWSEVSWKAKTNSIRLKLSDNIDIYVQFWEKDFKSLWGIHDYTRKVQEGLRGRDGEQEIFNDTLKIFQNVDQQSAKIFPSEPIKGCYLRLFERKRTLSSGAGERKTHAGHRLMIVTPPSIKALSSVNLDFDKKVPILFSYLRGEDSAPALLLKVSKPSLDSYMVMTFHEATNRGQFHSLIDGTSVSPNEVCSPPLPLNSFTISETTVEGLPSVPGQNFVNAIRWQQLRVIKKGPNNPSYNTRSALPEDLRIWVESETGSFVDRLNFGPGEMYMSLPVKILPEISVLRHKGADATLSFAKNKLSKEDAEALSRKLHSLASTSTIHYFRFPSLTDLHQYQALTTGFAVIFDGSATNFSISRRRMVVPIYKRWEVNSARLQLIKHDKAVQLVCFFKDFTHGSCMNFALKSTDVFESHSKSGVFYVRIVDAKFALPRSGDDPNKDFVCLDIPQYPGEHDDITIGFEFEADRDRFGAALPAAVSTVSRMVSLRR